jgi:spermidine synthase
MNQGNAAKLVLFVAFFFSGASGLIYQTVWVRMLTRYLGATTHATATVLVVFMTGLSLGSYLAGRRADRVKQPLLGYLLLELAIGASGLLASFAIIRGLGGYYIQVHHWVGDSPAALLAARVVFVIPCLLLPTLLMGATLPFLIAFVSRLGQDFQAGLGRLYSVNTYGAVVGVLAAGFVLIGELGEAASLLIAAGLNGAAVALALVLWQTQAEPVTGTTATTDQDVRPYSTTQRRMAFVTLFVSGLTALAYEILWSRLLVLLLKTSIYAFSTMLATFLLGIAWGSAYAARSQHVRRAPLATVAFLEMFIGLWTVVGLWLLPFFFTLQANGVSFRGQLAMDGLACVAIIFPVAFCFGVQFPAAVRCCLRLAAAPGRTTGQAYTVNTVGTIVGSLTAGFFLIPLLGTARTMFVLASINLLLGCALFLVAPSAERPRRRLTGAAGLVLLFAVFLTTTGDSYRTIMAELVRSLWGGEGEILDYLEGAEATTIPAGGPDRLQRVLFINGTNMSLLLTETKLITHLPYVLTQKPKRLLVICAGMGTTMRSASLYPDLEIDVVDIVPEVFRCFGYFHRDIARVLDHPAGLRLHADDGRSFLLTHSDRYDLISVDPAPPLHSAGTVNLYTREFFELCKARLTPGGAFCLWVPPASESEAIMIMKSFHDVFPEGALWGGLEYEGFYLIGGHRSFRQTPGQLSAVVDRLSTIEELGEWSPTYRDREKLRDLYLTDGAGLGRLVAEARAVTDDNPYTEFPLWRRLFLPAHRRLFSATQVREWLKSDERRSATATSRDAD